MAELKECPCCHRTSDKVERRRRNTSYIERLDELNWLESCEECFEEDNKLMAEQWADYYQGCL